MIKKGEIIMIIKYIAYDGTEFDDDEACQEYEERSEHLDSQIHYYDQDGQMTDINNAFGLWIESDEAAEYLHQQCLAQNFDGALPWAEEPDEDNVDFASAGIWLFIDSDWILLDSHDLKAISRMAEDIFE
ncbi:MAG: hypothetical protein NC548_22870 [Lachnospiraceae bacterium]|nr:hypothetical protein [Lachnospiraceae bacterium]